jgi:hypothetical protein
LALRQPKVALQSWLHYQGGGNGGGPAHAPALPRPDASDKSSAAFKIVGGLYVIFFIWKFVSKWPELTLTLLAAGGLGSGFHFLGLRLLRPVWKPDVEYAEGAEVYQPGRWWADPAQFVYRAQRLGQSGDQEPAWPPWECGPVDGIRGRALSATTSHQRTPLPEVTRKLLNDKTMCWQPAVASFWGPYVLLGYPLFRGRIWLSRHRHFLATAIVMAGMSLFTVLFLTYFILEIVAEVNIIRMAVTDPDPAAWPAVLGMLGLSEDEVAEQVGNATETAQQAVIDYGRSLIGDPDLTADIERLVQTAVREYEQQKQHDLAHKRNQLGLPTLDSSRIWSAVSHSAEFWDQAKTLAGKLASQALSALGLVMRLLMSTIDYFFSFSLYFSWVYVFVSAREDYLQNFSRLVVADTNVQAELSTLAYFSVQVVLAGLARSFVFHAALTWLIFKFFGVALLHIGALAAGIVSLLPVGSPWMVRVTDCSDHHAGSLECVVNVCALTGCR